MATMTITKRDLEMVVEKVVRKAFKARFDRAHLNTDHIPYVSKAEQADIAKSLKRMTKADREVARTVRVRI